MLANLLSDEGRQLTARRERCVKTMPATAVHGLEQRSSVGAVRMPSTLKVTIDRRRYVQVLRRESAFRVAFEVLEVAYQASLAFPS